MLKKLFGLLFVVLIFLYIFAGTNFVNNKNLLFAKTELFQIFASSLALLLTLLFWPTQSQHKWLKWLLITIKSVLVIVILFAVFLEAAIIDFSGMLFGPEAIYHFSWQAFVLGVKQYPVPFVFLILFLLTAARVMTSLGTGLPAPTKHFVFLLSLITFTLLYQHSVIGRYLDGYSKYMDLKDIKATNQEEMGQLAPLGILPLAVNKTELSASMGNKKNLIVIYLESFSDVFTQAEKYPELTPEINSLKQKYGSFNPYVSTAGFTMDGLISSLCGFLPNMILGNNSVSSVNRPYYHIPCVTDVLQHVGYYQEFWGGAKKSFADKGKFLSDHGFDYVWGWEDFIDKDPYQQEGNHSWWGLHDEDLFALVLERVIELHQTDEPFHLSVLTLGTHLKGFPSPSCRTYKQSSNPYLNAIYCADQLLGQFINQLENRGLLTDTIVLITGDHGVFKSSLTHELFGTKESYKNLLGIVIDSGEKHEKQPMALYDLAPFILDVLKIDHNVTFINGRSDVPNTDRIVLTRSGAFKNGEWVKLSKNCQNDTEPLNVCAHQSAVKKINGYTKLFGMETGLKYNFESALEVVLQPDRIEEILLNQASLKSRFKRNGFELSGWFYTQPGPFLIQFNNNDNVITNTFALDLSKNPIRTIHFLVNENDWPFLVFGIDHKDNLAFMKALKRDKKMSCLTEYVCAYKLDELGDLVKGTEGNNFLLNFKKR